MTEPSGPAADLDRQQRSDLLAPAPARRRARASPRGLERHHVSQGSNQRSGRVRGGLAIAALGIVFGDIGTSPLYAVQTVFAPDANREVAVNPVGVYGVASLIVWAIVLVVLVKYIALIMRADNDGEGGIMALTSLLIREGQAGMFPRRLVMLGIVGAALFFGDSLITPAISVLSAVEGIKELSPSLGRFVVPGAVTIILALFAIQRRGSATVGAWFGPVMLLWFAAIALCGLRGVVHDPGVLRALSPTYAVQFLRADGLTAFLALGGVVLAVTGAEALYADLGHFGASPIRRAWLVVVFPALVLNYLGQAALVLGDPAAAASPFFRLVPRTLLAPMILLATLATVIASQAVISGAFSLARQAARLGYLPSLEIRHTSASDPGQVYVPVVNAMLMLGVLALVASFGSSARLASAYGIAVTGTMLITGILYFTRLFDHARRGRPLVVAGAAGIVSVDAAFLLANAVKVPNGGWLPLLVAAITFTVMVNWHTTHERVNRRRRAREGPVRAYVEHLGDLGRTPRRVPGTAVFLARPGDTTAPALRAIVERIDALHEHVLILTVQVTEAPHVPAAEQAAVDPLGRRHDGIVRVRLRLGFNDDHSVPAALRRAADQLRVEGDFDLDDATYFISTSSVHRGVAPGLSGRLYRTIARLGTDPIRYYGLPPSRTLTIGCAA